MIGIFMLAVLAAAGLSACRSGTETPNLAEPQGNLAAEEALDCSHCGPYSEEAVVEDMANEAQREAARR